jgi:UDP-N-acetylmuramoyl-L-alanyl-D-glutamate--2,6-diaminopimelate ligase
LKIRKLKINIMDKVLTKIKKFIPRKLFKTLQPVYHYLLSLISAMVYRWPSEELVVIGITGTTGKTTTAYLLAKTLQSAGHKVGFTSTAMFSDGQQEWLNNKKMTMVGRFFTQKILRQMVANGCEYAIVETTSEGVKQFRHRFINYDILVFTGLYPEHIDSHGSFVKYQEAKGELFKHLHKCKTKYVNDKNKVQKLSSEMKKLNWQRMKKKTVINGDDEHAEYFFNFWAEEKIVFTQRERSNWPNARIVVWQREDIPDAAVGFIFNQTLIKLQLLGDFNAVNAMAAASVGEAVGLSNEQIKQGLENISGVPGRLEDINVGQNFTVIVDYAFEPNAVSKLYSAVAEMPHNNIIHVLGSTGGGRDIARRPLLGKIAGQNADYVIITNEDPYDDDPEIIIDQVSLGAEREGKKLGDDLFKIVDRREAIAKALSLAEEDDVVLITGKGCEQAICAADGKKEPWDDREVVRELLNSNIISAKSK